MSNSVNFKFGSTLENKTVNDGDFVAINKGLAAEAAESDALYGSIYKGNKILGTTEADKLYTTEDITIAGGPLAGYFDDVYTDGKIPAGTSLQSLFMALACVEKWPNPAAKASWGTLTSTFPAMNAVSATMNSKAVNSGALVEVGSSITIGAYTGKNVSANAPSLTFDNFSYGYATSTGKHTASKSESNPASVAATITTATDATYTLTRSYEGFTQQTGADTAASKTGTTGAGISFVADTVTVAKGSNKVTFGISVDKQVHSGTAKAPSVYYALSNLGNTDKDSVTQQKVDYTTSHTYTPSPAIPASPTAATFSVTGVYPIYTNGVSAIITADNKDTGSTVLNSPVAAGTKLALMAVGSAFAVSFANQSLASYQLYLPEGMTIKTAHAIHPTIGDYSVECKSKFVKNGTKTFTVQNVEVTYDVYEWAATEGPNRVKFTLAE